jgi:uncharacterized sulfatase
MFLPEKMKSSKSLWAAYARWIIVGWILVIFVRVVETLFLNQQHYIFHLVENELIGIGVDVVMIGAFLALLFPVFYLFSRLSFRAANIFTGIVLGLLVICHLSIIQYFIRSSFPLGGILIGHSLKEVFFTIRTVETNYFLFGTIVVSAIVLEVVAWNLLRKCRFRASVYYVVCIFSALAIFFNILINNRFNKEDQDFQPYSIRINKSYYFYRSIAAILQKPHTNTCESIPLSGRHELFPEKRFVSDDYPLLSETDYRDVLGAFFDSTSHAQLPNIVFIIVEGLGSRFLPDFHGLKLLPFLDSLSGESLYWDKALTVGERSFSVVPSLLASAPYGSRGFTHENDNLLSLSLVNMLSKYGYYSTFFYGQPQWFHNKGTYLHQNGLNKFIDCEQFPEKYSKIMVRDYFWGYHDQDLVQYATKFVSDSLPESPRLDIYFTGSTHQPFIIDHEELYDRRLNDLIHQADLEKQERKFIQTYWKYVRSMLFFDDALRTLFAGYKQHPSYQNTIFVITGDHPMSEIPIENSYQRYRTPIIIYSPLLKQAKTFHSVNSHLDIAPSLLTFLHQNYHISLPEQNAFIGKTLDTATCFRNIQPVVFMNGSRLIMDVFYENYFLSNEKILFKIHENDAIERVEDDILKEKIFTMLQNFKTFNTYCCANNRLIPDTLYYNYTGNTMLYQFENQPYKIIKGQEFGYPVMTDFQFSGSGQYYFDFCVKDNVAFQKDDPLLVLDLYDNETGEQIFWHGLKMEEKQGFIHFSFDIRQEKEMTLKSYFWNSQLVDFNLPNTSCHFYRLEKR